MPYFWGKTIKLSNILRKKRFRVPSRVVSPGPSRVRVVSKTPSPVPDRVFKGRVMGSFRVKKDSFTHYKKVRIKALKEKTSG